jgi:hypothetical protein
MVSCAPSGDEGPTGDYGGGVPAHATMGLFELRAMRGGVIDLFNLGTW